MPARTLNDFFAGFFMGEMKGNLQLEMEFTFRKSHGTGLGEVKTIKVEEKRDEEKEVMVRYGIVPPKWKTWNYEDFSREWNKTYFTSHREKI